MPELHDFAWALAELKAGRRVTRLGWNGKGMWLCLIPGSRFPVDANRPLAAHIAVGTPVDYQPHIDMFTAQKTMVPWLASQGDLMADDWMVPAND